MTYLEERLVSWGLSGVGKEVRGRDGKSVANGKQNGQYQLALGRAKRAVNEKDFAILKGAQAKVTHQSDTDIGQLAHAHKLAMFHEDVLQCITYNKQG